MTTKTRTEQATRNLIYGIPVESAVQNWLDSVCKNYAKSEAPEQQAPLIPGNLFSRLHMRLQAVVTIML